jgi:LysM repeat protein
MANPNLGLPGRTTPRARGGCRCGVLITLLALSLCALASFVGYLLLLRGPSYTLPSVVILEPTYGAELAAGQSVAVLSNAISADRIAKQELWVDGLLVYVASARDPHGQKEFVATLLWTPKAGDHTLIARATDGRGRVGTSDIVRVNVTQSAALPPQNIIQIAQPGDTFGSIAEENGVTPEQLGQANPGLPDPPSPGEWVNVPPGINEPQGNDDQPGGDVNDPGAEPIPAGEDIGPANPNPGFRGFEPPLLSWGTVANITPVAPDLNVASENCTATLTWRDNSNNEAGFYIYRLNRGARGFSRIATVAANNAHTALRYEDRNLSGDYQYHVAAYNNAGESASRIVQVNIAGQNCLRNVGAQVLEVEAESLTAPGFEEVYCYAALKGHRPFERVPAEPGEYLRWMSPRVPHRPEFLGEWNIGEHYGDDNKRIVNAPQGEQPFRVEVECWGARMTNEGGEAFSLGRFDQSHPSTEWDGRALTGRGDSFTLVYHIRPLSGFGGAPNAPVDADIPAPFGLRLASDFNDCVAHSPGALGFRIACAMISYPDTAPLVWDWDGVPEQIDGFRVYVNRTAVGGTFVPLQDVEKNLRVGLDPTPQLCGETWRYAVSAFDLNAESPRSESIALGGGECNDLALVEVELVSIDPAWIDDGSVLGVTDHTAENYGRAWFWTLRGEQVAAEEGASLIGPVRMSDVGLNGFIATYHWADLPLCHNAGDSTTCLDPVGRNHNKLVFLVREGEGLGGKVVVWDEDLGLVPSGDDIWCHEWFEFPAMSLDEWARFDETTRVGGRDTAYGMCFVEVRVRGLGLVGGSRVLPPGGGGPALSSKSANLQVANIQRNGLGNAQITLYNAGPDTLINDAVTLSFQVARVESGAGGSPTTIFEHEERALVTIPAFGQVTIDTGQVLLEGFENRVRVIVTAVNFTDPDLNDNAGCRSIEVPDANHVAVRECAR